MTANKSGPAHTSATQLDMLGRCGEQYRRVYQEGERLPPGISLLKGSGLHGGAEVNFTQKITTGTDLKLRQIVDAAVASYDEALAGGVALTPDEESRGPGLVIAEGRDDVAELATVHAREQAPQYQPLAVEQRIELVLPGKPIVGYVDLVALRADADERARGEVTVVDLKTSGKSKGQREADASTQLTVYAAAAPTLGVVAKELRLDVLVQTKTRTTRQMIQTTRGQEDFDALAARLNAFHGAVAAGSFVPASPLSWWCSPRWCGFFRTCPYVIGKSKVKDVD